MMKKITVAVHETTYRQARVWAAEHDASLSAVVAYLLETLPGIPRAFPAPPKPVRSPAHGPLRNPGRPFRRPKRSPNPVKLYSRN